MNRVPKKYIKRVVVSKNGKRIGRPPKRKVKPTAKPVLVASKPQTKSQKVSSKSLLRRLEEIRQQAQDRAAEPQKPQEFSFKIDQKLDFHIKKDVYRNLSRSIAAGLFDAIWLTVIVAGFLVATIDSFSKGAYAAGGFYLILLLLSIGFVAIKFKYYADEE